jgi:LmbE family N-acetylglucosaminyl deacetylase
MTNPYRAFVERFVKLHEYGRALPVGGVQPLDRPRLEEEKSTALIFSPHPDDECITGAFPLRLLNELRTKVINVAVTLGSNRARQAERWRELCAACSFLGFGLIKVRESGLEDVNLDTRSSRPGDWAAAAGLIAGIVRDEQPQIIFLPHATDSNSTHVGTHHLVLDALARLGPRHSMLVVESEYWRAMEKPNLMIESSVEDVANLVCAISFHAGEVRRNAYHLSLPAWMHDNVRRGSEIVGGQGGEAAPFFFSTLYRLAKWSGGRLRIALDINRIISSQDSLQSLLEL